jgi:glucokinase
MLDNVTLLADIGATNARFAISLNNDAPKNVQILQCEEFDTSVQAIDVYLKSHNIDKINNICFALAGPIANGVVKLTNNHWSFSEKELKLKYKVDHVALLNDFEAIAYSVTQLSSNQLINLNQKKPVTTHNNNANYVVLGAGTGLGVAALINRDDKYYPIVTEAGHVNFSPVNDSQLEIFNFLRKRFDQVSNEHLLSGPGIVNLYQAVCNIDQTENTFTTAAQICQAANNDQDDASIKTLNVFYELLGQVAGDLTLTFGAFDGVYIAGGIVQRYPKMINKSRFRECFENKIQHRALLENTPTFLVTEMYPGLIGANYYANHYM